MEQITYVVFLRGINVSGQKKISMASLRDLCEILGLHDVKTYIQSGNNVFKSSQNNTSVVETLLMEGIQNQFGFDVPVLVKTPAQLKDVMDLNPFTNKEDLDDNKVYFVLLKGIPNIDLVQKLQEESFVHEEFTIVNECVYLNCKIGYGKAKLNNNMIERKLKVIATTRNYRTMNKLVEMFE
jgi:uncharacterized protein (DUF1697 family)